MDIPVGNNRAGDLLLAFFDWGYRAPAPSKAGVKRRIAREKIETAGRAAIYFATPSATADSRQIRRARNRHSEKIAAIQARINARRQRAIAKRTA